MKKYLYIILSGLLTVSCVDTELFPYESTIGEDFWKTKDDVALMKNAAYTNLATSGIVSDLIVWGSFRSDELILNTDRDISTAKDFAEIETGNISTTNSYCSWASFYSVINYCNMVIDRAAAVIDLDPDYTAYDYTADVAQMKTLRALCYFYLVRAFRDVPYITTAYMQNSQDMNIPQTAPSVILKSCIDDLKESINNVYDPQNFTIGDWKSRGLVNRHTVYSLLADIYLWRASVYQGSNPEQSLADYQECVNYCTLIINEKNEAHKNYLPGGLIIDNANNEYPTLSSYNDYYNKIFVSQNSEESIFEIQFNQSTTNAAMNTCYYQYGTRTSFMAFPARFGTIATRNEDGVFIQGYDSRLYTYLYKGSSNKEGDLLVRKGVSTNSNDLPDDITSAQYTLESRGTFDQNFIIYRMTDIMLMKAEALTQMAVLTGSSAYMDDAFKLVKAVNDRAIDNLAGTTEKSYALKASDYNTTDAMETLVLAERLRELCFEGKRWYDLLRYNYRQNAKQGLSTNYDVLLADQTSYIENSSDMITLMARSNPSSSALISKMPTEPYLYMPIAESEIKVNPSLKQNPVYNSSNQYERK